MVRVDCFISRLNHCYQERNVSLSSKKPTIITTSLALSNKLGDNTSIIQYMYLFYLDFPPYLKPH